MALLFAPGALARGASTDVAAVKAAVLAPTVEFAVAAPRAVHVSDDPVVVGGALLVALGLVAAATMPSSQAKTSHGTRTLPRELARRAPRRGPPLFAV